MEEINLNELFLLLKTKGYNYLDANLSGDYYEFSFSTGYRGRGKAVEIQMYHNGFIDIAFFNNDDTNSQHKNKTSKQIIDLINKLPNN